jgi:hypothetical protein
MTEEQNIENVETIEKVENITTNIHTVSVDLSKEQYDFLVKWQKTHESELGIDVPLGSMVRKSVDVAMKSQKEDSDRKPGGFGDRRPGGFGDRKPGGFGDRKPGGFGDRRPSSFGDRKPRFGGDRDSSGPRSGARTSLLPQKPRRF